MDNTRYGDSYPACTHIKKAKLDIAVTKEILADISGNIRVLPLFEHRLSQLKNIKNSSLRTNEVLKCRWSEFVKKMAGKKRSPFIFPSIDDFHFSKYLVKYDPSITIGNRLNNRFKLKNGPGVDDYGQMPIPDDMHLRKSFDSSVQPNVKVVNSNKKNTTQGK